ncbi:SIR2 family protein [Ralstonia sp.]|uniref:SIR2 family protein n=1 Tax=Ralstonia sp. TaxID=54061 RepID=UPI0031CF3CFC
MAHLLLLGAGFTRNWDGWLAGELADDLIGRLADNRDLCKRLTDNPNFEEVLGELQREWRQHQQAAHRERLDLMERAVKASFDDMNAMLAARPGLEFQGNGPNFVHRSITGFLTRFDAIFTLNQDLLLELFYVPRDPRINVQYPGMTPPPNFWNLRPEEKLAADWRPRPDPEYRVEPRSQPIFKLHGSVNWRSEDGNDLLVMGARKVEAIAGSALLTRYADEFRARLRERGSRLMTIGYGFGDEHINRAIVDAAEADETFAMFVVNPSGRQALRPRNDVGQIPQPRRAIEEVRYIGGSTRPLRTTFTNDELEHAKLLRFFDA